MNSHYHHSGWTCQVPVQLLLLLLFVAPSVAAFGFQTSHDGHLLLFGKKHQYHLHHHRFNNNNNNNKALFSTPSDSTSSSTSTDIVILGGGFGGLNTALTLDALPWQQYASAGASTGTGTDDDDDDDAQVQQRPKITIIDNKERFIFLPLLYELCVGDAEVSIHYVL